jgi:hypothetical protein
VHRDDRRGGLKSGGCRYEIGNQIVKAKADCLFSLKGNQETLREDVKEYFSDLDFSALAGKAGHIAFQPVSTHDQKGG